MRTTAPRYIDASDEAMERLAKSHHCTEKFIYLALTYRSNTEKARKIRYEAIKDYKATPMAHYPECETLHDTTEGGRQIMRQVFNNGATLRVDKRTGEIWITNRRGEMVVHKQCISFPQLSEFQVIAENM